MNPAALGMVLKGFPRISETFISNEILLLERLGIPIRIFSMRLPREPFCHPSVRAIGAPVFYLPTDLGRDFSRLLLGTALAAIHDPKRFRATLRTAEQRREASGNLGTIKHLLQAAFLGGYLLRQCPEVAHFHAHFAHSPSSVALFASQLTGRGFSFTAHAKDIYTSRPSQLAAKMAQARFVVTCTEYNRAYLRRVAPQNSTPIHCLYHGIDLALFQGQPQPGPARQPYHLLTVARLTAKKGIPTILQALKILKDQGLDFTYSLIGDGDDRDAILNAIFELGLADRCRWHGTLPHDRVVEAFAQADLFVLGCQVTDSGDRDGIPNVLVESLAMGVPAVATRVSALPELLIPGETGLLVEPEQPEQMAVAIEQALTDQDLRSRLQQQGRLRVARHFDNQQLVARLADLFRTAIPALPSSP
jgi:glycosyltransferase involved in cell wall biosynthesis